MADNEDTFLYFAYGSNMCWGQMRERCPSAEFRETAYLENHKLGFPRKSIERGCGVAGVVTCPEENAFGVIYRITGNDRAKLDKKEGYLGDQGDQSKNSYFRVTCSEKSLQLRRIDGSLIDEKVFTYLANAEESPPRPNQKYMDMIICGAEHWKLPTEYIDKLKTLPVQK